MAAKVYVSAVMNARLEDAWRILRDFNGLPDYHPFFASSTIEGGKTAKQIGCVRNFTDHDGGLIREELVAFSERENSYVYRIVEGVLPVTNYVAGLRLWPITESDQTFGEWWAEFDVDAANEPAVVERVTDTFRQGFKGAESLC